MTFEQREEISQLIDRLTPEVTTTYYFEAIPSPTDESISHLVQLLTDLTLGQREQLLYGWLDPGQLGAMSMFAIRMSALAVREKSRELLLTGLLAAVFEGFRVDFRDGAIQALGVVFHSAGKIGADPVALFAEADSFARPEMADHLRTFIRRPDLADILTIMRYRESEGPDGFRYEYLGGPPIGSAASEGSPEAED
jgi:hypothetical protein